MTLLEAVAALVILGLSAVGYLDLYRGGNRALRDAHEWNRMVVIAESTMDEATLGGRVGSDAASPANVEGFTRHVERATWRGSVQEIVVTVESPSGARFALHRLARESR